MSIIAFKDIEAAHERIAAVAVRTPVLSSHAANEASAATLFFKSENLQLTGAFKFRGAYNALAQIPAAQKLNGVVTSSSGNHAQAVAFAAKLLGMRAVIVMPKDAPKTKLEATKGYGAEIIFCDRYLEDMSAIARKLSESEGMMLIPPYDHPWVMAGQGTAAKELIEEAGPIDVLVTPLGGGGLLSGCSVAARELCPGCLVYGVEPEAGNDGQQSFYSGKIVRIKTPQTIADGAQTRFLGEHTFPVIQQNVRDILTVSDFELMEAMRFFAEKMKIVVEPTGCLAAAAVFANKLDLKGKRVGVVISGGNVDMGKLAAWLS